MARELIITFFYFRPQHHQNNSSQQFNESDSRHSFTNVNTLSKLQSFQPFHNSISTENASATLNYSSYPKNNAYLSAVGQISLSTPNATSSFSQQISYNQSQDQSKNSLYSTTSSALAFGSGINDNGDQHNGFSSPPISFYASSSVTSTATNQPSSNSWLYEQLLIDHGWSLNSVDDSFLP